MFLNNSLNWQENTCVAVPLEANIRRCSSKWLLLKSLQIHRKASVSESSLVKLQFYLKKTPAQAFSCEICEILKNTCFYRTSPVVASDSFSFQPATLWKKRLCQNVCQLCSIFKTSIHRAPRDDYFLCLSVNYEKFFRMHLLQSTSAKLLIPCTSFRILTTRHSKCLSSVLHENVK